MALSLDGSTAETHDEFRRAAGSFNRTVEAAHWAAGLKLPLQINTTITRQNLDDFNAIAKFVESLGIVLWSVFFLVPTGRGRMSDLITAEEFEQVFAKLYQLEKIVPFDIKTTEAPHYRRYALQQRVAERRNGTRPVIDFEKDVAASFVIDKKNPPKWMSFLDIDGDGRQDVILDYNGLVKILLSRF